jgi:hypothetical protein
VKTTEQLFSHLREIYFFKVAFLQIETTLVCGGIFRKKAQYQLNILRD